MKYVWVRIDKSKKCRNNVEKENYMAHTVDFIIKVLGVYYRSMETIYLFLMHTGSCGTFFMKYSV